MHTLYIELRSVNVVDRRSLSKYAIDLNDHITFHITFRFDNSVLSDEYSVFVVLYTSDVVGQTIVI